MTDEELEKTLVRADMEFEKIKDKARFYDELQQRINKAIHRIQLMQMDGEVSIKDITELARILRGGNMEQKEEIVKKYEKKIEELYKYKNDEEHAHVRRDRIYPELLRELGYKELADLLEKVEDDIGFWYS